MLLMIIMIQLMAIHNDNDDNNNDDNNNDNNDDNDNDNNNDNDDNDSIHLSQDAECVFFASIHGYGEGFYPGAAEMRVDFMRILIDNINT